MTAGGHRIRIYLVGTFLLTLAIGFWQPVGSTSGCGEAKHTNDVGWDGGCGTRCGLLAVVANATRLSESSNSFSP